MFKFINNRLDANTSEVVRKSISSLVVKIIGMISSFLLSIFLGRQLGASGLGIINLSNGIVNILIIICMLGTRQIIVREVAIGLANNNNKYINSVVKSAYILNSGFTLLISLILILCLPIIVDKVFENEDLKWPLAIGILVLVSQIISKINTSFFIAYRKIWQSNLLDHSLTFFLTLLMVLLIKLSNYKITIVNTAVCFAISKILVSIITIIYWKKLKTKTSRIETRIVQLFKTSFPLLLSSTSNILISNADVIILGLFVDATSVGLYTVASRLAMLSSILLQITNSALSGNLASLYSQNKKKELQTMIQKVTQYLTILAIIPVFLFYFFGDYILSIWGKEFVDSYKVLLILTIGQFFNIATGAAGQLLIMCGFHKTESYITTSFMIVNIIFNLVLIYNFGVIGAAYATAITVIGVNLTRVLVAKQKTGILTTKFFLKND